MTQPKVLDLFSGEGGAGHGYHLAGCDSYAVEWEDKRALNYPYAVTVRNVFDVLNELLDGEQVAFWKGDEYELLGIGDFNLIHASPNCQGYSISTSALPNRFDRYDRWIARTRAQLIETGLPYVIENVMGAKSELINPIMLCGRMFDLGAIDDDDTPLVLDRHRLFELSPDIRDRVIVPDHPRHSRDDQVAGVYGGARRDKYEARHIRKGGYVPPNIAVLRELIGAEWMSEQGLFLSIPPAYTEYIGKAIIDA